MPKPNQLPRRTFEELSVPLNQQLQQMADAVNTLAGYNGKIELNDHLDLGGKTIQNVGPSTGTNDVVTQAFAQENYSAAAIRPQLEATGSSPLQSVRRLNDSSQREQTSTWLNEVMSTPPSASTAQVSFSSAGGGMTQVTVNATNLTHADGSIRPIAGRTDMVTNPTAYTISSISRASGVVTLVTSSPSGIAAGFTLGVFGVTDSSFDGSFVLTGSVGSTLTYSQLLANATSSGGFVSIGGVYYYYAKPRQRTMFLEGPYSADTPENRINASNDQKQILAVAVVTASGGSNSQSGGGGTPTSGDVAGGSFF